MIGAILIDLSKAFDSMDHKLLIEKLKAYNVSEQATDLLGDYLSHRKQRVKLGNTTSQWADILKGVPQGSILGPILFNIFINDLFYFITKCNLHNFADDNTLSKHDKNPDVVTQSLKTECRNAKKWIVANMMQANLDKFQGLVLGPQHLAILVRLIVDGKILAAADEVKLLGLNIDNKLNFDSHISETCKKAATQLNALARLSRHLDQGSRMTVFKTFLLSNFNYCPTIWHFCKESNTKKLEKLQERGLRCVYNDFISPYSDLLDRANLKTLHLGRIRSIACETYKILNNIGPTFNQNLFIYRNTEHNTRGSSKVLLPSVRTTSYGLKSLRFYMAVKYGTCCLTI